MKIAALQDRLRKYNVELASSTIRKLAHERVITPPHRYEKKAKMGKGGPSNWSDESLADIVAFWKLTRDVERGVVPKQYVREFRELWDTFLYNPELMLIREPDGNWHLVDTPFLIAALGHGGFLYYQCEPTFERWIAVREKVLNNLPIENPILVIYRWTVYGDANDEARVALEESPDILESATYSPDIVMLEFISNRKKREATKEPSFLSKKQRKEDA